jgi:hypothetical protein
VTDGLYPLLKTYGRPYICHGPKHVTLYCKAGSLSTTEICVSWININFAFIEKHTGMPRTKISFSLSFRMIISQNEVWAPGHGHPAFILYRFISLFSFIGSWERQEIYLFSKDRLWDLPRLLFNGYLGLFSQSVKRHVMPRLKVRRTLFLLCHRGSWLGV